LTRLCCCVGVRHKRAVASSGLGSKAINCSLPPSLISRFL
jgi:hypothetical protein